MNNISIDIRGEHFWQTVPGVFYWSQSGNIKRADGTRVCPGLLSFGNIDECINWIYLRVDKQLARDLNAAKARL